MTEHQQIIPIAARLAALTPREVDAQVASSVRQCVASLERTIRTTGGFHREDGTHVPLTYHEGYQAIAEDQAQIDAARRRLAHTMTPPTPDQVVGWLAELSVITARRPDDDTTEDLRLAAYSRRLATFPADIARHALLVERYKFFPTWDEVATVCEKMLETRNRIATALTVAENKLRERELRARALPTEATAVPTDAEAEARKSEAIRMANELLAGMKATLSAQEQADKDRRDAAAAKYASRKPKVDP